MTIIQWALVLISNSSPVKCVPVTVNGASPCSGAGSRRRATAAEEEEEEEMRL